jgi:hypothetical protein
MRLLRSRIWIVAAIAALGSHAAEAKVQSFALEGATVKFDLPDGWEGGKDAFNLPLTLVGPRKEDKRPVVSIIPTGQKVEMSSDELKRTEYEYRMGRRSFIEGLGGEILGFKDYEKTKVNGNEVHVVGYRYSAAGDEFAETSYYIHCREQLFMVKTVSRSPADEKTAQKVVKSFECQ